MSRLDLVYWNCGLGKYVLKVLFYCFYIFLNFIYNIEIWGMSFYIFVIIVIRKVTVEKVELSFFSIGFISIEMEVKLF